jgi:hypothetical protein
MLIKKLINDNSCDHRESDDVYNDDNYGHDHRNPNPDLYKNLDLCSHNLDLCNCPDLCSLDPYNHTQSLASQ